MPGKLRAILPVAVYAAGAVLILFRLIPLGVPDEFVYPYVRDPSFDLLGLAVCVLPGAGILATLVAVLKRRKPFERPEIMVTLAALVACSFLLHVTCSVFLSPGGVEGAMAHVIDQNGDGAYMLRAFSIEDTSAYLKNLHRELDIEHQESPFPHLPTHPPGFVLLFYTAKKMVLGGFPGTKLLRSVILGDSMSDDRLRPLASAACLAAVVFWVCAALLPLPTYFLARMFLKTRPSLIAAGMSTLFPGTYLFNPITDQMLPLVASVVIFLGVKAITERRRGIALAFGITLALSINLTLAMIVPAGVVFFFGALHAHTEYQAKGREGLTPLVRIGLRAGTGLAIVIALLYALLGLNMIQIGRLCFENNREFNLEKARSYLPFLLTSPIETAYSFGLPLFALLVWGTVEKLKSVKQKVKGHEFLWAALSTIFLLAVLGINRGEVCRLWMFLFPSLAICAVLSLRPDIGQPDWEDFRTPFGATTAPGTVWTVVLIGQILTILFLCTWLDPMWRGQ